MQQEYQHLGCRSRDSSVDVETDYGPHGYSSILFFTGFRPALGPTQPLIQWLPGVKRQRREADHSPPTSAEVKNGGAIPPLSNTSSWRGA
jgi:hypothetical protein